MENQNEFKEVIGMEPVTQQQVGHLIKAVGGIGVSVIVDWNDVDYNVGRGVLKGADRCLWTNKGHRISISVGSFGIIISQSTEPDPYYFEITK